MGALCGGTPTQISLNLNPFTAHRARAQRKPAACSMPRSYRNRIAHIARTRGSLRDGRVCGLVPLPHKSACSQTTVFYRNCVRVVCSASLALVRLCHLYLELRLRGLCCAARAFNRLNVFVWAPSILCVILCARRAARGAVIFTPIISCKIPRPLIFAGVVWVDGDGGGGGCREEAGYCISMYIYALVQTAMRRYSYDNQTADTCTVSGVLCHL